MGKLKLKWTNTQHVMNWQKDHVNAPDDSFVRPLLVSELVLT